ncbi:M24 family metallopeptidase [Oceanibacterium hippocampi]|uniref:Xaa-Pro dipeptidase n=1 Tax=Oceanibacterium hippocampi TaxID=745714 RepID=A0A1Y5TLH1_9PROT|nr:Xaa-Pro peptidase family protein [Oceanibacterium hippocampi]SLN64901.1 Xaa-Pro dipeptidase [Oceanibacterium hippocampi]
MPLHFESAEFASRKTRAIEEMGHEGLEALLMFRQESLYYLTGCDGSAYCRFQVLLLQDNGDLALLLYEIDLPQARLTSGIDDIRCLPWTATADPAGALADVLREKGLGGKRVGIELDAWGINAALWAAIERTCGELCRLSDASRLIDRLRVVKSAAEIACVRQAAALADDSLAAAIAETRAGADEGAIAAAMSGAVLAGGGDLANGFVMGSGRSALLVRGHAGYRTLDANDQLQLEFGAAYRRYHACLMRVLLTGRAGARQRAMFDACAEAIAACQDACRPGATAGDIFDAHARVFDAAGYEAYRLKACGYSLGATYGATWMDYPMLYSGNDAPVLPGMVFFMHMILVDHDRGLAMSLGETALVTERGCETLTRMPRELVEA